MANNLPHAPARPSQPVPRVQRQKRAAALTLTLMAAAPVVLLIWDPLYRDMRKLQSLEDCDGVLSEKQCMQVAQEVERRSARMAPSYARFEDCEREFASLRQDCPAGTWCAADIVRNCIADDTGLSYPQPAGFVISESLLSRLRTGETVDWSTVEDDQLQPAYALGGSNNEPRSAGHYVSYGYGGATSSTHLFTRQGQYLGAPRESRVNLHYRFFADTPRLHYSATEMARGGLPSRFYATVPRGGFGATARTSLSSAIG